MSDERRGSGRGAGSSGGANRGGGGRGRAGGGRSDGGRPEGGRGGDRRGGGGRPEGGRGGERRGDDRRGPGRSDDRRSDDRRGSGRSDDRRGGDNRGGDRRGDSRPQRGRDWSRSADKQGPRTADQQRYDGPDLPDHITGAELDSSVTSQLKGLPEKLAARVARHLAAAQEYVESDPELAYQHARAARGRAARLAVVREACGESAYAAGHYAEALAELRAAKRMNGATEYLPMMADCHRALGHPDRALKLAQSPGVERFSAPLKAEMTIIEAGARRDLGQLDAALRVLERAPLMSKSREAWVVRLRYTYADTLLQAGRDADALAWFHRTHAIDSDEITDSAERAEVLERRGGE